VECSLNAGPQKPRLIKRPLIAHLNVHRYRRPAAGANVLAKHEQILATIFVKWTNSFLLYSKTRTNSEESLSTSAIGTGMPNE
jgi:hypothetical protein